MSRNTMSERFGSQMKGGLKDACQRSPAGNKKGDGMQYLEYLDKMQENLNRNINDNMFPHWRQHPSLKGNLRHL